MEIVVNRKTYEVADEPDRPLLWVLRDELGLTGTKYGCGVGLCGSCEIHLDGSVARSCITTLSAARGKAIRTIEGLASEGALHPVQQAFLDEQVHQCGWCMSGQMMRAVALLEESPNPTEEEIVAGMTANYCRCGASGRIKQAVAAASREMAAASEQTAAASREIATASEKTAAASREMAAASEKTAAASREMATASEKTAAASSEIGASSGEAATAGGGS